MPQKCRFPFHGDVLYETNEVRIKTSRSGGHKRQETDITRKKVVKVTMFFDLIVRSLLNRAISVFDVFESQGAVREEALPQPAQRTHIVPQGRKGLDADAAGCPRRVP